MQLQNELHRNIHYTASTRRQENYRRNIRHQRTRKIIVRKTSSPRSELLNQVDALNSSEIKESIKEKSPNLFTGLGKIKYQEYDIKLAQEATPYAIAVPRQFPILLHKETERELQRMERSGVISRVEDPAEWCAPMVVTPKSSGKVRVCVDLIKLSQFVQRKNHPLPTTDKAFANLASARYFSGLEIKLSKRLKPLTTFITPWGRYCFNVLPFGISSGSEKFKKCMSQILEGLDGVECNIGDVLFHGTTQEELDRRLEAVLQRLITPMSHSLPISVCSTSRACNSLVRSWDPMA